MRDYAAPTRFGQSEQLEGFKRKRHRDCVRRFCFMAYFPTSYKEIVKSPGNTLVYGHPDQAGGNTPALTIAAVKPAFLEWIRYELRRSQTTVKSYNEALKWIIRDIGDQDLGTLHPGHVLELRRRMEERGCRE